MMQAMLPPRRMRLSWEWRCLIVQRILAGSSPAEAAASAGASRATGYRLWRRYQEEGFVGLRDRSSRPKRQPRRLDAEAEAEILALRETVKAGPQVIAQIVRRPASTVGKALRRAGVSRLPQAPRPPVRRYERERPGELLHVDTKRLGRFWMVGKRVLGERSGTPRSRRAGWQYLHVAIDDHTRLAYAEILSADDGESCAAFLERALGWYATQGITVERVLTDNAKAYRSSHAWRAACARNRVRRRYTRPYTPRTNGKAEALIKTMLREWAYRFVYPSSQQRARALPGWLRHYNRHRPHGSLNGKPPISRVSHLCGQYS